MSGPATDAMETFNGLARTAGAEVERIRAAVEGQARKVANLSAKGRKLRKALKETDVALRMERRFLRAMIRDLGLPRQPADLSRAVRRAVEGVK